LTFNKQVKSIILLSGGLDSVVSLGFLKEKLNVTMALTFDYGQKAVEKEIEAAKRVSEYYSIEHKVIKLPWLKEITKTSLVNRAENLPGLKTSELDNEEKTSDSAQRVWVPNRNGLMLNVAGCFADSEGFGYIIFGANKEEAATFPDNSKEFVDKINASFEYSTLVKPKVVAPLVDFTKEEIIKTALDKELPLNLVRSCYIADDIHCGKCESCLRLKRALQQFPESSSIIRFKE